MCDYSKLTEGLNCKSFKPKNLVCVNSGNIYHFACAERLNGNKGAEYIKGFSINCCSVEPQK